MYCPYLLKIEKERTITNDNVEERKDRQYKKNMVQPPVFNTRGTTRYLLYRRKFQRDKFPLVKQIPGTNTRGKHQVFVFNRDKFNREAPEGAYGVSICHKSGGKWEADA